MVANFSVVNVLITGLREALIGKMKKATLASIVARKLTDERARTERIVRVKDGRMFVTITAIRRFVRSEYNLLTPWHILEDWCTVIMTARHKVISNVRNIVLMQI